MLTVSLQLYHYLQHQGREPVTFGMKNVIHLGGISGKCGGGGGVNETVSSG